MISRRVVWGSLGLLTLAPVLAATAGVFLFLDGPHLTAYAVDAVRRATGRELTVAGPVRLGWSLTPTLSAQGVALANPPGLSRPAMATLARVDVKIALWPLLRRRLEVRGLILTGADVLLERDAAGRPNWEFTRPTAPSGGDAPAASGAPAAPTPFSVDVIEVRDARIGLVSGGRTDTFVVSALDARPDASGMVRVAGTAAANGVPLEVQGKTGALAAAGAAPGAAWPVDLRLSGSGAALHAAGALGSMVALTAEVPDLAALSALAGRPLPPLRDMKAAAQLGPAGLSAISAQAAGTFGPLHLTRLSLAAAALDQPLSLSAEGDAGGSPLTLAATLDSPAALLRGGAVPVKAQLAAAGATLAADGTADMRTGAFDMQVSGRVPDAAALGVLAGLRLPSLRDVSLQARASRTTADAVMLRGMRLAALGSDLAGDLDVMVAPRVAVRGTLASGRMDLDALAAALARPDGPYAAAPPVPPGPAPGAPANAPPNPPSASGLPLPFDILRRGDVDLQVSIGEAVWRRVPFRTVAAHLRLEGGRLRLNPVTAAVPGGAASALLEADADTQSAAFSLQGAGLAAGPLLQAFGVPDAAAGTLDVDVAMQGAGATAAAMRPTLAGHVGVALVDGEFDLGGILAALGDALPKGLPLSPGGRSRVRCFALHTDVAAGQATLGTLLLDSARLQLAGEGTVNLVDETLDLHLRPQVRLGVGGVSVPVRVSGPVRAPRTQAEIAGGAGRRGLLIGAPPPPDECAARLTEARGGRAGPMPAAAPEAPPSKPADLLRNLLR